MKTSAKICLWILLALAAVQPVFGGQAKNPPAAPPTPARSVFTMPSNPQEGRDPFFPESTRPYAAAVAAAATTQVTPVADLKVKGYYHDAKMSLITINNHTFAVGDEADLTSNGERVRVRCLEIMPGTVIIEANGLKQELHF